MDFYLDFEATQFSERVIAIGCTNMASMEFDMLCKPRKDKAKVTRFITELTGITQEEIDEAESTETAFRMLQRAMQDAIAEEEDYSPCFYHVYGDCDKEFLLRSAKDVEDQEVKEFMTKLAESLIDDSKHVRQYFHAKSIGLHRALQYFFPNIPEQDHDPLHDAQMLGTLMYQIKRANPLEDCPFVQCMKPSGPNTSEIIRHTKNRKADATYQIRVYFPNSCKAPIHIFYSLEDAQLFTYNTAVSKAGKKGGKPGKEKIYTNVAHAVETGEKYGERLWIKEPISE